ncbi:MAG: HAD family phosphatase [Caulobacteraceae bacterium]|nr:HAD family phosphatase [Caulobacteraceae bacterium]
MPAARAPVGVLWDVGNVIVRWDPRTLYSKIFPDPAERERFLAEVCTPAWHRQHDLGRPMAEGVAALTALHPDQAYAISAWSDRWSEMFSGVIEETVAAMTALHARATPMFGLTNMPSEVWPVVSAMHPAFGLLRSTVVSGDERLAKPDPGIFALASRRAGLTPQELLFVDDVAANIEAARALGFHVHLFDEPSGLAPALADFGLL